MKIEFPVKDVMRGLSNKTLFSAWNMIWMVDVDESRILDDLITKEFERRKNEGRARC